MPSDLEFVGTKEMLEELQQRMDNMIFVGSSNRTADQDALLFVGCGSFHGCLGLIEAAKLLVLSRDEEPPDD
jgi:hypothetical protein